MTRTRTPYAAALALAMAAAAAPAGAGGVEQLRESLRFEILGFYPEADVDALRPGQLVQLHAIINSSRRSESDKRMLVRSALGRQGPGRLRDLLLD